MMRDAAILVLGFLLLIGQGGVGVLIPLSDWTPNLILPMAIYLGVSHDTHLVRGAFLAFLLGYLLDSFSGSPMGLQTFVIVASFLVSRGAGLNLVMRGPLFQIAIMFVFSLICGTSLLALRAIFEPLSPFPLWGWWGTIFSLVASSITTALASPLIFFALRRVEALVTRRREEGPAAGV